MLTFENPVYLTLFILLLPAIYFRHIHKRRGGGISFPVSVWKGSGFQPKQGLLNFLYFFATLSFWIGLACIILALAGPAISYRNKIYTSRGSDIMIILDQSPSLAGVDPIFDYTDDEEVSRVRRIDFAKNMINKLIDRRTNDAIGLIGMGTEVILWVPPTQDYGVLRTKLEELTIQELGDGTSIGMAIATASLHLQYSSSDEKIIILFSDGESNSGEVLPETAADIAKSLGIRIYTIGVGSEEQTEASWIDQETNSYNEGSYLGGYNEELLAMLANKTQGAYFNSRLTSAVEGIVQEIDNLESLEQRIRIEVNSEPVYREMIIMALIFLMIEFIIMRLFMREVI